MSAITLHSLRSTQAGFEQISQLYQDALRSEDALTVLNCARVNWVDANMSAPLAAVQRALRVQHGRQIKLKYLIRNVEEALRDIGFFTGGRARSTMVRLRHFEHGQSQAFAVYSAGHLEGKGLPDMTAGVSRSFFQGIDEIFQNFEIHSRSALGLYACGQLYPHKKELVFTLADMGVGIPDVVARALRRPMRASAAIDWAMSGRNTTRQLDVPGGLGLKLLRQFIDLNGGSLCVVSGNGYWNASPGGISRSDMLAAFPGTVVTITVNTADAKSYQLIDAINPEDVF